MDNQTPDKQLSSLDDRIADLINRLDTKLKYPVIHPSAEWTRLGAEAAIVLAEAGAALSARVETMDTAPKDGTPILGFVPSYYEGKGAWVVVLWLGKKGMRDAGWMDNRAWKVEPQCWMPLPAIPSYVGEKK